MNLHRALVWTAAAPLYAQLALGQAVTTVPPSKRSQPGLSDSSVAALDVLGEVAEAKTESMQGLSIVSSMSKDFSATRGLRKTADAYGHAGNALTAIDTLDAVVKGDKDRIYANARDLAADGLVTAGCSLTGAASGPCEVAYGVGHLIGKGIDLTPKLFDQNNPTLNEMWTSKVVFPSWEAIGCPGSETVFGVDPKHCGGENSQAVRGQARQRFENTQRQLEAQQRELDAQRMQQVSSSPALAADGDGVLDGLMGALGAYADYEQQRQSVAPSTPASGSGCHPGHDEQAHPGGCQDYSGTPR